MAAGPGIGRGEVGAIDPLDLAPTFLSILDAPRPATMRGRASATLLDASAR